MTVMLHEWVYLTSTSSIWPPEPNEESLRKQEVLEQQVRDAVDKLDAAERLIVERHYFEGKSLARIARETRCSPALVQGIHRRTCKRLRKLLAPFVLVRFGITAEASDCPICRCAQRLEVEAVIVQHEDGDSYCGVISELRNVYGVAIVSPQTIIGHIKYHC